MDSASIITLIVGVAVPILTIILNFLDKRNPEKKEIREQQIHRVYAPLAKILLNGEGYAKQLGDIINILSDDNVFHLVPLRLYAEARNLLKYIEEHGEEKSEHQYKKLCSWVYAQLIKLKRRAGHPYLLNFKSENILPRFRVKNLWQLSTPFIAISYLLILVEIIISNPSPPKNIAETLESLRISISGLFLITTLLIIVAATIWSAISFFSGIIGLTRQKKHQEKKQSQQKKKGKAEE